MSKEVLRADFDSLASFVEYASRPSKLEDGERVSRTEGEADHFGTENWDECLRLAPYWEQGAEKLQALRVSISAPGVRPVTVLRPCEVGPGVIMMADYVSGSPSPWAVRRQDPERIRAGRKIVRIVVNATASGGVSGETILTRGAAILALVDALERQGRRCEIIALTRSSSTGGKHAIEYRVMVKRADRRINIPSIAFALANPSFQRRLTWSARECEPSVYRKALGCVRGGGYGVPEDTTVEGDEIYFGRMLSNEYAFSSPEAAREWVMREAERQGIKVRP